MNCVIKSCLSIKTKAEEALRQKEAGRGESRFIQAVAASTRVERGGQHSVPYSRDRWGPTHTFMWGLPTPELRVNFCL